MKPDAILCADLHIREDQPVCRTDDFQSAQWKKLHFISDLQRKYDCAVLCSGDVFDYWKPSPYLISKTISHLPKGFLSVYGNHDLPQHNMNLVEKSGLHTLVTANTVTPILYSYGQIPNDGDSTHFKERSVLVWHVMTFNTLPYPGCTGSSAKKLLRKYKDFDLIVTGDNHETFTQEYNGRILINPGSLTRQTAKQINHEPCVFLYYAKDNSFEKVVLPHEKGVISREHIEVKEKHDQRLEAFISSLSNTFEDGLSFEENVIKHCDVNNVKKSIKQIILNSIE